ncbi:Serine/threonine-protein kinase Pkn1 [Aquisphaera giovannonii]|uniref:Serine/threonine-protein kinase Pkn1 n=1 Tax=Aquisphaera giovannonii TaxID=406548 RepID=A0A5B9VVG6_9BACT|nr:hypothetical protein [Aquisphaera giovannonii]QEH32232.1 Serine/threonine-protein kinase Pkn1 [Aquisphaera giovannonii]
MDPRARYVFPRRWSSDRLASPEELRFRARPDSALREAVAGWAVGDAEPTGAVVDLDAETRAPTGDAAAPDAEDSGRRGAPDSEPPSTAHLRPMDELAGFRIVAKLGQGAEGAVYLATQTDLADRPVVLKVGPLLGGEHRSLARLQHAHIVPILSMQDLPEKGLRLLCLPYLGGATLERLLDELAGVPLRVRRGRHILEALDWHPCPVAIPPPAAGPARQFLAVESYERSIAWIGLCLAEALHHAHVRDLVHWDVKPANILLASDGMPLLLDFHLAQPPLRPGGPVPQRTGGTPPYLAPEQFAAMVAIAEGRPVPAVGPGADIYALAMVLHVALADKLPSGDARIAARLRRANPRVSPGLAAILARALARDPRRRYPSAAAFAEDLGRHLDDRPLAGVANRSPVELWTKWHQNHPVALARAGAAATALLGLAAAGLVAWFAADRRIGDAVGELERGRLQLAAGDHRGAAQSFDHGLAILASGTPLDRLLPRAREAWAGLVAARARGRRAEAAAELHGLADRVRFLYAAGPRPTDAARRLEGRLAAIWRARGRIRRQFAEDADEESRARLRADLLDLAILWADLRVELADEPLRPEAHREAMRTLAEAEAEAGPSPVLSEERRFHAEAIGLREPPSRDCGTPPRTAWEHYALARALLRRGDLEGAAAALDLAVALQPQSLWAQFYRGRCALLRNRPAEAVDAFGACVALAPEAVCYFNRSLAYAGLGVADRSRDDLARARAIDAGLTALPPRVPAARRAVPGRR